MTCYLDDDVDQELLIRLAMARSHRLISPRSLGQSGQCDALHFLYAVSQRTPLMTRNANDFEALHEFALGAADITSGSSSFTKRPTAARTCGPTKSSKR